MTKYICKLCHYVYDPPDDWVCPECGADKSEFEEA